MNYLLPHIRRMPEKLARDQFAVDAAQKLGIDSAVLREELRQAALRRRDRVEARATSLTEVERVLLRALAIDDPENEDARRLAAQALADQPTWFEHLGTYTALQALAARQARDPMDVVEDPTQRALLAEALLAEVKPPEANEVRGASRRSMSAPSNSASGIFAPLSPKPSVAATLPSSRCSPSKSSNSTAPCGSCTANARRASNPPASPENLAKSPYFCVETASTGV